MQFDKMNCTILKLDGRPSFQLPPTSAPKCFMQSTNLSNPRANGDNLDLFDAADDFKVFIHKEPLSERLPFIHEKLPTDNPLNFMNHHTELRSGIFPVRGNGQAVKVCPNLSPRRIHSSKVERSSASHSLRVEPKATTPLQAGILPAKELSPACRTRRAYDDNNLFIQTSH